MEIIGEMFDSSITLALILGFLFSTILGPILIPVLRKLKFGQNIREDGPKSHLKKAGTPTIGGLIFIGATALTMIIMVGNVKDEAMVALYAFLCFGFVGFLDDLLKIIRKKNLGLRAYQKMILLIIFSVGLAYYVQTRFGTEIYMPFGIWGGEINLGVFYIPLVILYFTACTNAVNLTDGLDGLATSVTILATTFMAILSYNTGHKTLAIFSVALCGALLGFLRFNAFPARIFMGDTGSLALGGAIGSVALLLKNPIIMIIVGGIYVVETLSVIIQVTSFKLTGKRVFKMAPLHHHFEQLGWSETKIVTVFSIITALLCFLAFFSL